jgi:hypothetical protein
MNNIDKFLENSVLRIYEGLSEEAEQGTTLEELNTKINTILNALGLADDTVKSEIDNDKKTEPEKEPEVEETDVEDLDVIEDTKEEVEDTEKKDDVFTVDEGMEGNKQGKYVIHFSRNAVYKDWFSKIENKLNDKLELRFNSLDELLKFVESNPIPLSYNDIDKIEKNSKEDKQNLLTTMNYRIFTESGEMNG